MLKGTHHAPYDKHTPYGVVWLSGQVFRRKDTLHQANQLATSLRKTFAHAGLHPTIEVKAVAY